MIFLTTDHKNYYFVDLCIKKDNETMNMLIA